MKNDLTFEDGHWFEQDDLDNLKKDKVIFEYTNYTYGCCTSSGTAISLLPNKTPFLEVPNSLLKRIGVFTEKEG